MLPDIGLFIRDERLNVYSILDSEYKNTHSQYPSSYFVECIEGPHFGRSFWCQRKTIVEGNFPVSKE